MYCNLPEGLGVTNVGHFCMKTVHSADAADVHDMVVECSEKLVVDVWCAGLPPLKKPAERL